YFFSYSLHHASFTPHPSGGSFLRATAAGLGENRSPQAKIAGCARLGRRIFLPRLWSTPANANVRADFFQRKEKFQKNSDNTNPYPAKERMNCV
ncbi:MAG TPA: hypothetical protein VNB49_06840, partial [Candidatus Dormibacteraeota bacterium]|nr:hypothetical protein [Candidatus Dormibacteraeota bacterium]